MKIKFFDEDGHPILTLEADASDHWGACAEGHRYLAAGTISGADDFDVIEDETTGGG